MCRDNRKQFSMSFCEPSRVTFYREERSSEVSSFVRSSNSTLQKGPTINFVKPKPSEYQEFNRKPEEYKMSKTENI